jgi:hypothetical protein
MQTVAKMIDPQSISEQIMYCTVRLVGVDAAGAPKSAGTGFIYNIPISENRTIPVLITNKHVAKIRRPKTLSFTRPMLKGNQKAMALHR